VSATRAPRPILDVAASLGIDAEHVIAYGQDKAKISLAARRPSAPFGRLVLVSALTPTPAGEGKTTTAIGLAQGFAALSERVAVVLREPSLGPTFGLKGGATGSSRASLVPAHDINLHFTGDFHAISAANNLLAAALDNHLQQGNALGIDPRRVLWRRVMDMNDRAMRKLILGLGGPAQGVPRETGFDITPASEVMAVLCLAEDEEDLRQRLSRMLVAQTYDRQPVTAADLKTVGAMMVLLKDAIRPNLVQTIEGVPAFVHGGPFANIAHGCNSVLATKMAMAHADWVVTEAGFGFDLGGEKFFDIKCRSAGLAPAAVVLVATVRALKCHGGVAPGDLAAVDPAAVERGLANLNGHIDNAHAFGVRPVVAINVFDTDSAEEIAVVERAMAARDVPCALSRGVQEGGAGTSELARAVRVAAAAEPEPFRPAYALDDRFEVKLDKVAKGIYGAGHVEMSPVARRDLRTIETLGYEMLPLCVAKTPTSFSADAKLVGRPTGFTVAVQNVVLAAGAGFLVPLLGSVLRMPGLGRSPQLERIDLVDGEVINLR